MGTTANRAFPYPDAADPFALGNEQIQALADALDDDLEHSRFADSYLNLGQSIANTGADIVVGWNTTGHTLEGGWTWDSSNNRWTYSGPDALFLVTYQLVFNVTADGGTLGTFLRGDAADPLWGASEWVQDFGGRPALNVSGVVHMGPTGYDTLDVRVRSQLDTPAVNAVLDGGDFGGNRISCVRLRAL